MQELLFYWIPSQFVKKCFPYLFGTSWCLQQLNSCDRGTAGSVGRAWLCPAGLAIGSHSQGLMSRGLPGSVVGCIANWSIELIINAAGLGWRE